MKNFDDYLSAQAKASRKIEPCHDPAGALIRASGKNENCDCPWMSSEEEWGARKEYVRSISRGGGTTDFS